MRMFKRSTINRVRIAAITAFSVGALAFSGCKDDDPETTDAVCGDGVVDEGEECDDGGRQFRYCGRRLSHRLHNGLVR